MCDPITIAGIALTAGSTVMNSVAQGQIQAARNDAMAAERVRQNTLDQEAQALNTTSQDRYQDFEGQEEQAAGRLADYFTSQEVAEPTAEAAVPGSANNLVVNEEAKQRGKAREFTDRTGNALGTLRAFGDVLGDTSRLQARDAGLIGQVGGFKRGSSGVLPFELEEANQKGGGLKLFADILGGAGSVATGAGLGGGNLSSLFGAPGVGAVTGAPTPAIPSLFTRMQRGSPLFGGV